MEERTRKIKGKSALSEFADYVEKQQTYRHYPALAGHRGSVSIPPSDSGYGTGPSTAAGTRRTSISHTESVCTSDELDFLDTLDLTDTSNQASLKELLLDTPKDQGAASELARLLQSRIEEGHGETLFDVGTENNGVSINLNKNQWDVAIARIHEATRAINAGYRLLLTRNVGGDVEAEHVDSKDTSLSGTMLIRQIPATVEDVIETRIAVVGNVDAGKSTLLGVLVKGYLDDGRGKARVNLFRHKHEIESGRTSSVGMEIMGFTTTGDVVVPHVPGRKLTWEEIGKASAKVITFTDLAGHERYLRTTVFGLLSSSPNYCLLIVAANNGLIGMSKEHLGIALALNVPVMIVITKIDICPPNILQQTIAQICKVLKSPGARKLPVMIKNMQETVDTAAQVVSARICPIFQVSNVSGQGLDLVRTFLNILPHHGDYNTQGPFEFHVNDIFSVPFVGTVVSGIVKSGCIHEADNVLIGPDSLGQFVPTTIRSIERKRIRVPGVSAGHSASFALKRLKKKDVRKGMVVLAGQESPPKACREFVAEVLVLSHATTIKVHYQAMLHVGPVSQTCAIIDINRHFIRTGDRAFVAFRFVQRPEYICPGDRILFREGRTRGLGVVKSLGYDSTNPLNPDKSKDQ